MAEERLAQTAQDVTDAIRKVHEAKPTALVHCGFGFGILHVNAALEALGWDPPRFTSTAFQNAWISPVLWNALLGWTGIDQYDEANLVGQRFLDQYEAAYGRRPQYCVPVVNRDIATVLLRAFADARPLSPRGVKEALERVKMLPAATGAPGTMLRSGIGATERGWALAISWPGGSIPTESTRISSIASVRTDAMANAMTRERTRRHSGRRTDSGHWWPRRGSRSPPCSR